MILREWTAARVELAMHPSIARDAAIAYDDGEAAGISLHRVSLPWL